MRKTLLAASAFTGLALALPAVTFAANPVSNRASNLVTSDTKSQVAPELPTPNLGPNATVKQYLSAAQSALSAGQTGLAQSSLENAETLALTRAVPYTTGTAPLDNSTLVKNIQSALRALGQNDLATAQHYTSLASQEAG